MRVEDFHLLGYTRIYNKAASFVLYAKVYYHSVGYSSRVTTTGAGGIRLVTSFYLVKL